MSKKKIVLIIFFAIIILSIFFLILNYKNRNNGNNIIKSADRIKEYILNISSYRLEAEVIVNSNKNQNKYLIKQEYNKEKNFFKQEIIEPVNIKGVTTIYDGSNLKVENTNLNLSNLYENYPLINSNNLWFSSFIADLKEKECYINEEEEEINIEVKSEKNNKILKLNKNTLKPTKLVIEDSSKNISVYIEYKEIEI